MSSKTLKKVLLLILSIAAMLTVFSVKAQAATNEEVKPVVYDAEYYINSANDLKEAYTKADGSVDQEGLYNHYLVYGIREGRQGSPVFDIKYYLNSNKDLLNEFKEGNYARAYQHFLEFGFAEGRSGSKLYNCAYYKAQNADVAKAYANQNNGLCYVHFAVFGQGEGRKASTEFDIKCYLGSNKDLKNTFKTDYKLGYRHYALFGHNEKRVVVHTWNNVNEKATCTKDGRTGRVCKTCGLQETTVVKATGHKAGEPEIKEKTCTVDGSETVKCTVCNEVLSTKTIPAGHNYVEATEKDFEDEEVQKTVGLHRATCTENGHSAKICTICKNVIDVKLEPALDHNFTGEAVEGTDENAGKHSFKCVNGDCEATGVMKDGKSEKNGLVDCSYGDWSTKEETITDYSADVFERTCKDCSHVDKDSFKDILNSEGVATLTVKNITVNSVLNIPTGKTLNVTGNFDTNGKVTVANGATLNVDGKLILSAAVDNNGTINVGTLSKKEKEGNSLILARINNTGTLTIDAIDDNAVSDDKVNQPYVDGVDGVGIYNTNGTVTFLANDGNEVFIGLNKKGVTNIEVQAAAGTALTTDKGVAKVDASDKKVLNLNGCSYSNTKAVDATTDGESGVVENAGTLKVINGSMTGTETKTTVASLKNTGSGSLTLENVSLNSNGYNVWNEGASLSITGGTFEAGYANIRDKSDKSTITITDVSSMKAKIWCLSMYGANKDNTVVVTNVTMESTDDSAIYLPGVDDVTISNSRVKGQCGIETLAGKLNVLKSEIESVGTSSDFKYPNGQVDGSIIPGYAIAIRSKAGYGSNSDAIHVTVQSSTLKTVDDRKPIHVYEHKDKGVVSVDIICDLADSVEFTREENSDTNGFSVKVGGQTIEATTATKAN